MEYMTTQHKQVADKPRRGGSGTIHPNAYHPNACMVDRTNEVRYCGWLLHGHPWCGTHGHKCEELPSGVQVDHVTKEQAYEILERLNPESTFKNHLEDL